MNTVKTPTALGRLLVSAIAASVGLGFGAANANSFNMRIGSGHPATLTYVSNFQDYFVPTVTERVAAETEHSISFTEAYGGSVAGLPEVFDAVEAGLLDIGLISTPFEPSNLFLQNYGYRAPFGEPDPIAAAEVNRQVYDANPALRDTLMDRSQRLLAVLSSSNYAMITNFEWDTLDDLDGHRIQAAGANLAWLEGTGATPVQGGLNETYNGIQTGVFDGMVIHYQAMSGFKLYEVAPYIARVNFGSLPINIVTMNAGSWDRLPPEIQTIIEEEAAKYEDLVHQENAQLDGQLLEEMVAAGATVLEIAPEVITEWASNLQSLPNDAAAEGDELGLPMRDVLKTFIGILSDNGNQAAQAYQLQ